MTSGSGSYLKIIVLIWADILAAYALWVMMTYLTNVWKLNFTHAAAIVNIFTGAATMMPIAISYLVDTLIGNYWMLVLSSTAYSIGMGFLAMSTPPVLSNAAGTCSAYKPECIGNVQTVLFYTALALIAVGMSGHLTSLGSFLSEQAREEEADMMGREKAYVIMGIFAVVIVPLVSIFALAYIKPWDVRFGIPAICTLVATLLFLSGSCSYISLEPRGSPFTRLFRVFVASILKIHLRCPKDANQLYERDDLGDELVPHTTGLRCLDKAAIVTPSQTLEEQEKNRWRLCRVTEVEETKIAMRMIPMWMTFIVFGIVLSIGNTYFLEQANHMNRKVGKMKVPLPILLMFYDMSKSQATQFYAVLLNSLSELKRKYAAPIGIGIGFFFAVLCCITAAKVEGRRIDVIKKHDLLDKPDDPIPMTIFWLLPQFLLLGAMDGLASNGIECFYQYQAPSSIRSYMSLFSSCVFGAGIIGSVLSVHISGKVSERGGRPSWFQDTLNKSRLDNYYWTLAVLSSVNLIFFIVVAIWYAYRDADIEDEEGEEEEEPTQNYDDEISCCCC